MEEWLSKHMGKILSSFIAILLFSGTLMGYIYKQDQTRLYNSLQTEIKSRKEADEKLDLKIQTCVSRNEFREFKGKIDLMCEDQKEMKKDIKKLLSR